MCSPESFFKAEDNWFGFVALSADTKEVSRRYIAIRVAADGVYRVPALRIGWLEVRRG